MRMTFPLAMVLLSGCGITSWPARAQPTNGASELTLEQVLQQMAAKDKERIEALRNYVVSRRYRVENKRFGKRAAMEAVVRYTYPGAKEFEVRAESGSGTVRKLALRRMIETEKNTSRDEKLRRDTQITPANYDFQLLRTEVLDGRLSFALRASPKTKNSLLFRGTVWVDAEDFAVARIEGSPAKNPSFWTRKIRFVHEYRKFGAFWLPVSNHSRTDVLIFGATETSVEYYEYQINTSAGDGVPGAGGQDAQ